MRRFETAEIVTPLLVMCVFCGPHTPSARADFVFGKVTNAGPAINSSVAEPEPCPSPDGLEFYFYRGPDATSDIWVARRATRDSEWNPAVNLGPVVNCPGGDGPCYITPDGLTFIIESDRTGGSGTWDLWTTTRATVNDDWGAPINMGATVNSASEEWGASMSGDGLELYFTSNRPGGLGGYDLWKASRATMDGEWSAPVNLAYPLNTGSYDTFPSVSTDGLLLFFVSGRSGNADLYMSRRATMQDPWGEPVNLGPEINSPNVENCVKLSADGSMLYFFAFGRGGNGDIFQIPLNPIANLNNDDTVNIDDLAILIERWGKADPHCDIGPFPWGDGIVDAADLKVLMDSWGQEVFSPHLIACWRLDEAQGMVAADSVGTNAGTLLGEPLWQPTGGKIGGALQLDGVDDCVTTEFVFEPSSGPASVFAWIKGGTPGEVILSQSRGANWLLASALNGVLVTELKSGRGGPLTSTAVVTDGAWHRVGLVWDGADRILYVDDVEVARDALSSPMTNTGGLHIGAGKDLEPGSFWSGVIDDVRIYNQAVKP